MKKENTSEKAVALQYKEHEDSAPRVVAKGRGLVAEKIREIAESNGIPIRRDDDLVELLAQIEIDREVPPELYAAIAEILSWIYRANDTMKKENSPS
jgi:flagellar biosynthesis protein